MKMIKKLVENICKLIVLFFKVIVGPLQILIADIVSNLFNISGETSNKFNQIVSNIVEKLRKKEGQKVIINISALIYYLFLTYIDVGLIGYIIHQGKIPAFKIEELMLYGLLYIIVTIMMLNTSLKHSDWSGKIKLFVIIQTLAIIPVMAAYWIVSIEGKTFYLNKMDINQWSNIFNNMLIYVATCIFGISQAYKKENEK